MKKLILLAVLLSFNAMAADLPDPKLTPGAVYQVTAQQVCTKGYAKSVRHVSGKTKHQVYMEYSIVTHRSGEYEVDHLISLELGGSNDIRNLWPQSYETTPWNAHVKDKLENKLHYMVCRGEMPLKQAQEAIAGDWVKAYKRYVEGSF